MDPSQTAFGDPGVTVSLMEQQAVIGVVAFESTGATKAPGNTGTLNIAGGNSVGRTCAVCHSITDNAVLAITDNAVLAVTDKRGACHYG